ncbi:dihydrofolate reductase [Arthrobacter sp. CAN_A6]|uniref:dihydrofolate reductase family protein n=1 Tax=Arthrobacter sp. CAN_A6 TaxID=2787721 RepID=UPI0018CAA5BE
MTRTIFSTATTLDGYIADESNSLDWLFAVDSPDPQDHLDFLAGVGVLVEGSTTYEWVLREERLLENPGKWREYYGDRPTFVFTSRNLPVPAGADVHCVSGPVHEFFPTLQVAAAGKDIWVVGGGDLAGQFLDAGLLDEIQLFVAPAALASGAPLLPRRIGSDRLTLRSAEQRGQFAYLVYDVARIPAA